MSPVVKVLGEIRVPRLGILTIVENSMEDAWQIQLTRENRQGPLMTIAVVDTKIVHIKHDYTKESEIDLNP
jgi:hypothetical protein